MMAGDTHSESRVTVWMSDELKDRMDEDYVDWRYESRSQWVREAAESRMVLEDALATNDIELPGDQDERDELIRKVVRAGVLAAGDDLIGNGSTAE